MARLNWGVATERFFETGIDRGVLYTGDGVGVPWNGLTSVSESPTGGEAKPAYIDGYKFRNIASSEEYEATIEAFSSPKEFGPCDGSRAIHNGLIATQQPRQAFNFSYRTLVGNAVEGPELGYKIHLVYNALAGPAQRSNGTVSDSVEASRMSWGVTTLPPSLTGMKPTAHFVIDSRETPRGLLAAIEDILYGTEVNSARMPLVSELVTMFQSNGPLVHKNLHLNPSWRTTNGTVEIRRNLFRNPTCSVNATDWTQVNQGAGTTTGARVAPDGSFVINGQNLAYYRQTWTAVTTGALPSTGIVFGSPTASAIPVTAGVKYYISGYARSNHVGRTCQMLVTTHDSGNTVQTVVFTSATTDVGNGIVRISGTFTVPATHVYAYVRLYAVGGTAWAVNDTLDLAAVLVEASDVLLPYFDGDTTGLTLQQTSAWTATAGASQPILKGPTFTQAPFLYYAATSGVVGWQSEPGVYRILCKRAVPSSGLFGFTQVTSVAVVPGEFFSGRLKARQVGGGVDIPLSPALAAYTATPAIVNVIAGNSATETILSPDSGWGDIERPSAAAAGDGSASIRWLIYNDSGAASAPAGTVLEFTEAMVEKVSAIADLVAPYFDGSTADSFGINYAWDGPVDNSMSSMYDWN